MSVGDRAEPGRRPAAVDGTPRDLYVRDVSALTFRYPSRVVHDDEGHAHPGAEHDATQHVIRVRTRGGHEGYCVGGIPETARVAARLLAGMCALDRELAWMRLHRAGRLHRDALSERGLAAVDMALWDLAGRATGLPVHRLIGGYRTRVPAYASTMCGDELPGGLDSPAAYADFAQACREQGYGALKLHTWMPPIEPDIRRDVAACAAVRARVGPEMRLMLDPHHGYDREEALYLGRALQELDFTWLEEPMDENSVSSYVWLAQQLDLSVVGPESAPGHMWTRAEWIVRGAADILRYGVWHGGITPTLKAVHLCESFGMRLELHGSGAGSLQVLGAMAIKGEYYERGLLHPLIDRDAQQPWLRQPIDPIDAEGRVSVPDRPGLGEDIDWDFIRANTVQPWR